MKIKYIELKEEGYERIFVAQLHNGRKIINAIIAIHNTTLGPAVGGTRMWSCYKNFEEALRDAKRLSAGMTYKAATYCLNSGGGKAVIFGGQEDKSPLLFKQFGHFINEVNKIHPEGYITGEDVGITNADLRLVKEIAPKYVGGLPHDPKDDGTDLVSPVTAYGQFCGSKACLEEIFGSPEFKDRVIAIQGVGKVGYALAELYHRAGANLIVSDMNPANVNLTKAKEIFRAKIVSRDEILTQECDIFAPCALGAILNDETIPRLKCAIVAGSANNQLAEEKHGKMLMERGILYAPDYVINAGGLLIILKDSKENIGWKIYRKLQEIIKLSKKEKRPTNIVANEWCDGYINYMKKNRNA